MSSEEPSSSAAPPKDEPVVADPAGLWLRLLGHRRKILLGTALLSLVLLPGLLKLQTDNSPSVFFVRGSAAVERYEEMQRVFGSDESVRLVLEGPDLWRQRTLSWLEEVETRAADMPGVARVSGLYSHYRRYQWPPEDIPSFRQEVAQNPLDRGAGWVARDGSLITVLLQLEEVGQDEQRNLLGELDGLLAESPKGVTASLLGLPVLNRELDLSSREIERRFFPLLVLFALLLLGLAVRHRGDVFGVLAFVGLCQLLVLGVMGYAGARLNLVSSILPPLIFVISLATALHLLLRYRHSSPGSMPRAEPRSDSRPPVTPPVDAPRGEDGRAERLAWVMGEKGWAVAWTGVTTVVGFASLTLSPVAPIRSLGLWASVGIGLATLAALSFLPALLATVGSRERVSEKSFEDRLGHFGERMGRWACRQRKGLLAAALAAVALLLLGIPHIRIESNALRYLAKDHPLRSGTARLEAHGVGMAALELLVTLPRSEGGAPAPFVSAIEVERLADLGADLEQLSDVYGVVNAGVVLRDAVRRVPSTPTNAHMRSQMVLEGMSGDEQGKAALRTFLSPDRLSSRSTLFVRTAGAEEIEALVARVIEMVHLQFPEAKVETSGEYPLLLEAQHHLISTLVTSLGLTLLVIGGVLRWLLPSSRLAFLALLPNLWPVLGAVGAMGWLGIPLDIATVMMASVALGLAVDDTIHTLAHFRKWAPIYGSSEAVARTLRATAPAYVLTGVILIAGFGICALSDFAPISRFGSLSALAISLAVLGDLFLLPALLSLVPDSVCQRL